MLKRLHLADAGGDTTTEGRRVRTGLLYRSSAIHKLRPAEREQLESLRLKHIVDLREPNVIAKRPDVLQVEAVTRLPVGFGILETVRPRDVLLRRVDWDVLAHTGLYADVLEGNAPLFHRYGVEAQSPKCLRRKQKPASHGRRPSRMGEEDL